MPITKRTANELRGLINKWLVEETRESNLLIDCANVLIDHREEMRAKAPNMTCKATTHSNEY